MSLEYPQWDPDMRQQQIDGLDIRPNGHRRERGKCAWCNDDRASFATVGAKSAVINGRIFQPVGCGEKGWEPLRYWVLNNISWNVLALYSLDTIRLTRDIC